MSEPLRLLLVEDSPVDAKLVLREVSRAFPELHSERVETGEQLRAALAASRWDLILCDWSLPSFGAMAALELVKVAAPEIPLIIISGTVGEESAVEAMRAGARDYVLKDNLRRLVPAIERELREAATQAEKRAAEASLRASEQRFARLYESGVIGIAIADLHGQMHDGNDAYLKMIGYTREDLRAGRIKWAAMVPPDLLQTTNESIETLRKNGVVPPFETEQLRKDGTRVPVLVAIAMLDYPKTIALVADLSERTRAQAALKRTEEQLRQAQKMEAIGILAGGVAHDFNNILSVILSYCELMLSDLPKTDPMRTDIGEIKTAGERATALTRQLLAFSRQQIIQPHVLDLNEILTGMDQMLRRLIREDVELQVRPDADLGRCKSDAGQIEQIIMNLVVNARDAMPEGGKLTLETANVELDDEFARDHVGTTPGQHVMLAVSDTGTGMDRATQARIFEPFFTTKPKGQGTGLGLSTVFGIVEQSGGSVWVYSELGQGTTFKVYLPRTDDAASAELPAPEITSLRGTETVLVVEDEAQIRVVAKGILRRQGYRVLEASNAGEALLLFEQEPGAIDLLLTDVVMPKMNGKVLADRLRQLRPGLKVIFMSGYTDGALVGQLAEGAFFIQKPFTLATLSKKVRDVLGVAAPAAR